jgi:pilus assembly protein Flp/PilA
MLLLNKFYKKSTTTETQKKPLKKNTSGATAIEYGLMAALISVAIIVALQTIGSQLKTSFTNIGSSLKSANG